MPFAHTDVRAEFETALAAHVRQHGKTADRSNLVKDFCSRGASRATLYRWADEALSDLPVSVTRRQHAPAGEILSKRLVNALILILSDEFGRDPAVRPKILARINAITAAPHTP